MLQNLDPKKKLAYRPQENHELHWFGRGMARAMQEQKGTRPARTAGPKLYYQRTKIQPVAGDGRSDTKVVLPENENPAGQRPFRSGASIVPPENENPAERRRRPFRYKNCIARERKSSRPPATAVPVLKLYYQKTKIQPVSSDGRSDTKIVLRANSAGRRRRPFQY